MRKLNAIVSLLLIILFLIHTIAGSFQMMKNLSYFMLFLIGVHIIIGIKLTIDSIIIGRKSGKFYFRENAVFWTRRITGIAMILLVICHVLLFTSNGEVFRLNDFNEVQLIFSIFLVFTLLVHILANIRPLLISFGISGFRLYIKDILLILAIISLFGAFAFVIYYLRWNIMWRY